MKKLLAITLLSLSAFYSSAAELTLGQAQIHHYNQTAKNGESLMWNEFNEFVDLGVNKFHVGAFENSFKDVAPYVSMDVFSKEVMSIKVTANLGVAYYKSDKIKLSGGGEATIHVVSKALPIASVNLEKSITKNVVIGATIAPIYAGSFIALRF